MQTFLVTGAASGIGRATTERLLTAGHTVYAGVLPDEPGRALLATSREGLRAVELDITSADDIERVIAQITEETGHLDGLVNVAGIALGGPVEHTPLQEWRDQLEVNLLGQIAVTQAALPLIRRVRGRVTFIGSLAGKVPSILMGPYSASKFAIEGVGETLRQELHPWGIQVAIVEPGAVKTGIWAAAQRTADRLERTLPVAAVEAYSAHIDKLRGDMGEWASEGVEPDEVARAVEHSLTAKRPKLRYPVGIDAKVQVILVRLLPDRWREAFVRRITGPRAADVPQQVGSPPVRAAG